MKKTATIDLKGKAYAQVKDRIKEFRVDCPNGFIETSFTLSDTSLVFKARILKDKANPASAEAVGHSFKELQKTSEAEKQFEKQETISVGRALALLGYASNGEIASSEEMEEFNEYKQDKLTEAVMKVTERIGQCSTADELKEVWSSLSGEMKIHALQAKDAKKKELDENN
jgi:mannose-6-phosphate isomerase-like protein (cupin superfamily)